MQNEVLIKSFSNVTKEGLTLHLNRPASLKTGNIVSEEFWVSWDKIGGLLFDRYADIADVEELRKLRSK